MPGKLPRPAPPLAALDALLAAAAPVPTGVRLLRGLAWSFAGLQIVLLAVVHASEGDKAFLEGGTARTLAVALWLQALPMALAAARHAHAALDEGVVALATLRGVSPALVQQRAARAPLAALLRAMAPALLVAGLWPLVLSLGDGPQAVARRLAVGATLCALTVLAGVGLVGAGLWVGRRVPPGRAPWLLLAAVVVPWLAVALAGAPRALSLPGLYRVLVDAVLNLVA